jgi:hypothetical protein
MSTGLAIVPSYAALRRAERRAYRECCELFRTLQRLNAAHFDPETYLAVSALYRAASDAHFAACDALRAWYGDEPTPPAAPAALRPAA